MVHTITKDLIKEGLAINLIYHELTRLVDDYYKCDNYQIKELILNDINFLSEAILKEDEGEEFFL